jgi:8-oxo-dGTP pyrophosphatase MutT (NUDIX family)
MMSDPRLAEVITAVRLIDPVDAREASSIERLFAELERLEQPFDENADPVHLTASGLVVGIRGTVLHRHRKLGIWVQPGGHVDPGETAPAGALRETIEETGLQVAQPPEGPLLLNVDCHEGPRGHTHLDLRYVLLAAATDPAPGPGESLEVRWVSFPEAAELAEPALRSVLVRLEETWRAHEVAWRAKVESQMRGAPG